MLAAQSHFGRHGPVEVSHFSFAISPQAIAQANREVTSELNRSRSESKRHRLYTRYSAAVHVDIARHAGANEVSKTTHKFSGKEHEQNHHKTGLHQDFEPKLSGQQGSFATY